MEEEGLEQDKTKMSKTMLRFHLLRRTQDLEDRRTIAGSQNDPSLVVAVPKKDIKNSIIIR